MLFDFFRRRRDTVRDVADQCGRLDESQQKEAAMWVVAKFNELTGRITALETEAEILRKTLKSRNSTLASIRDFVRPYVTDPDRPYARKVFNAAWSEIQEMPK